jgi:hypothetical protein
MPPTSRLARIRAKLEQVRPLLERFAEQHRLAAPDYPVDFKPALREEAVEEYERKYQLRLPRAYRSFLLRLGNGGPGPAWSGLFELKEPASLRARFLPQPCRVVPLANMGCGTEWELVVSGPDRGNVWYYDEGRARPCNPKIDFLTWYEAWVDSEISGERDAVRRFLQQSPERAYRCAEPDASADRPRE